MATVRGSLYVTASSRELSSYDLLFAEDRVVMARLGPSPELAGVAGGLGGAFAGGAASGYARASAEGTKESHGSMTLEQVLHSDRKNWEVRYDAIRKVLVKKGWIDCELRFVYADGKKDWFKFPKAGYDSAKTILGTTLGPKLEAKP